MRDLDEFSGKDIAEKTVDAGYAAPWCPLRFEADSALDGDWARFENGPNTAVPGRLRHSRFMPRWASRLTLIAAIISAETQLWRSQPSRN
ncbi:protein of unknown function [Methylocella tundrae]|uniref:Uncharacterized protein n=1 Tax=Methylocella tundrae TaxID=227605 RepID=A0A4U8Z673_METTU|nr:protein of unknown function [Methylocella tundrae]